MLITNVIKLSAKPPVVGSLPACFLKRDDSLTGKEKRATVIFKNEAACWLLSGVCSEQFLTDSIPALGQRGRLGLAVQSRSSWVPFQGNCSSLMVSAQTVCCLFFENKQDAQNS